MRVTHLDPISLKGVDDIENAPYIIDSDLKIYFESEANKLRYMHLPLNDSNESLDSHNLFAEEYAEKLTGTFN
ncbi:MAG: hypothetical protein QNJ56_11015 [Gammaproteobacteria bacterium]|nr:hypothetical protein [Gammaproteobacteria bacterium]